MSPIQDPRFSKERWSETLQKDRQASARAAKMEYIKPLVMLVLGGGIVLAALGGSDTQMHGLSGSTGATAYPIVLAVGVVFGIIGLFIASYLFLGGAGPLGLAVLRLAGIYAATDCAALVLGPLAFVGLIIEGVLYVGLLTWLFELDFTDSFLLAVITYVLKIVAVSGLIFLFA